jgi:hypothetical protein
VRHDSIVLVVCVGRPVADQCRLWHDVPPAVVWTEVRSDVSAWERRIRAAPAAFDADASGRRNVRSAELAVPDGAGQRDFRRAVHAVPDGAAVQWLQGRAAFQWLPEPAAVSHAVDNAHPADAKPRVQLYAPEAIDKEKPRVTEEPPAGKKPAATFPVIPQFAEVKTNVYAGLRPGAAGLDWLQSNRLGTVVCLHSPGEDPAADKKETEARGLRFFAIEVSPQNLTKEGFDGFIKLVRDNAEKGIFVYDRDGSIAGPMWYLYLRMGEYLDDEPAQLRARSLGLQTNREGLQRDMWVAVQKLLSENNP